MAAHSSILAWRIPGTEEPSGLPSMGSHSRTPLKRLSSSVQFSRSVVSDSLRPHESQHTRPPCPSPTSGVHSDAYDYLIHTIFKKAKCKNLKSIVGYLIRKDSPSSSITPVL